MRDLMRNEVTVNKAELGQIRDLLKSVVEKLTAVMADLGCLHQNAMEVTTMGGGDTRKFLCPDCGETIEEEIEHELAL